MEGRHVFISILAALVAYAAAAAAMAPIALNAESFIKDVITAELTSLGAPQEVVEEAVRSAAPIAAVLPYLIPLSVVINSAIIGSLFGMLYSYLIGRVGSKVVAALATGAAHAALTGLGVVVIYAEGLWEVVSRYVTPHALLTPALTYFLALTLFSLRGPWERLADDTPSKY